MRNMSIGIMNNMQRAYPYGYINNINNKILLLLEYYTMKHSKVLVVRLIYAIPLPTLRLATTETSLSVSPMWSRNTSDGGLTHVTSGSGNST